MRLRWLFLAIFTAAPTLAVSPPPLPGWTHVGTFASDSAERHGVYSPGGPIVYSSAVVGELDGITANGKEVVVASADGTVTTYSAAGVLLWTAQTPNFGCGPASDRVFSSPAVGALSGRRGINSVVIGYGGFARNDCDGGVVAFRGTDGSQQWKLSLKDFARRNRFGAALHSVYSTPALADVDHDGKLEIGFGSLDRNVYLLEYNGRVRWFYNAADTVFSSPTFANVDRSSNLEMIVGTDISRNDQLRPPTRDGGFLYAFKTTRPRGSSRRIGFNQRSAFVWKRYFNQVIQSSPIVADVISSRRGKEIVVGSGCFFPQNSAAKNGNWIQILRLSDGAVLKTLRAPGCMASSPAVGDIDGDRRLEIVATINGIAGAANDDSQVVAWNPNRSTPLWATAPRPLGRNDGAGGTLQSPSIADLDGNGSLEIIVANSSGLTILHGHDGTPITCQQPSCANSSLVLRTGGTLKSTPVIDDLNGDGILDVLIGGTGGDTGVVFAWTNFAYVLTSPAGRSRAFSTASPMFRGNPRRTGVYP